MSKNSVHSQYSLRSRVKQSDKRRTPKKGKADTSKYKPMAELLKKITAPPL